MPAYLIVFIEVIVTSIIHVVITRQMNTNCGWKSIGVGINDE